MLLLCGLSIPSILVTIVIYCSFHILSLTRCLPFVLNAYCTLLDTFLSFSRCIRYFICAAISSFSGWIPQPPWRLRGTCVMRQLAFMASISDLDMTLVILLDTGCSQHTFAVQHYFSDLRMFKPHEMTRKIQGIGGTIFQPIGIDTISL